MLTSAMDAPGLVPESISCHACNAPIDLAGQPGFTQVECLRCHAISVVPLQFGNLLLLNPLGIGGMGTVYKAIDLQLNRYVAVKILRAKFASDPQFIAAFAREARAAAAINHPNIAQVYAFTEQNGQYCLIMELLERGSLDDRITKLGKLPEADVLIIGAGIAAGLRAAHQSGLTHRDIKPGNILFNDEGIAKLVDFGLAGAQHEATGPDANVIWGTPYYIAPEKLRGQPEDFHSDMYSLGATLFHALAGRPPFDAKTAAEVLALHASAPAFNLKTYNPTIQDSTSQVIGRMLAKEPTERFITYDALIQELHQAEHRLQTATAAPGLVTESGERIPLLSLIATIAAIVAAGVVIAFLWFNRAKFGIETSPAAAPSTGKKEISVPAAPVEEVNFDGTTPWANTWSNALANLASDNIQGALSECENLKQLTRNQPHHRQWAQLLEGVTLLAAGRGPEAEPIFQKAVSLVGSASGSDKMTPTTLAQPLAALFLDRLPAAATTNWPGWAIGFTRVPLGLKQLADGQLDVAQATLTKYQKLEVDPAQRWVVALQPLAKKLTSNINRIPEILVRLDRLQQADKLDDALKLLNDTLSSNNLPNLTTFYLRQLDERKARLQQAAELKVAAAPPKVAAEPKADVKPKADPKLNPDVTPKAKAEHRAGVEPSPGQAAAETAQVRALETNITVAVNNYNFQTALAKYAELAPKLTTPDAKRMLDQRCAPLLRLAEFKKQLAADFARQPFDARQIVVGGVRVEGQLARATEAELIFQVKYGDLTKSWNDLTPATLQEIGRFYAKTSAGKPVERARRYLDLAVFAKQFNLKFADDLKLATQLDPALQAEADSSFGK